jgi:hypothetical protein
LAFRCSDQRIEERKQISIIHPPKVCPTVQLTPLGQVAVTSAVHSVAGAVSGAINSVITGTDIGLGALTGAVAAGIGSVTGNFLPQSFGYQLVGRVVSGGIAGGVASQIYGGNFWQGFAQGAATAAAAFLFNECLPPHREGTFEHPRVDTPGEYYEDILGFGGGWVGPLIDLGLGGLAGAGTIACGAATVATYATGQWEFTIWLGPLTVRLGDFSIQTLSNGYQGLQKYYDTTHKIPTSIYERR